MQNYGTKYLKLLNICGGGVEINMMGQSNIKPKNYN
jgi:hypothetical protein